MKLIYSLVSLLFCEFVWSQNLPEAKLLTSYKEFEIRMTDELQLFHRGKVIFTNSHQEGIQLIIHEEHKLYFLNDTCYNFDDEVQAVCGNRYKKCSSNIILDVKSMFDSYFVVQNYQESKFCNDAIESIEYPEEDSMLNGEVQYHTYQLGSSSSYLYDYIWDINLFEKTYFSFAVMEDLLFAFNLIEHKDRTVECQFDLFKFENERLTYCHSDTLSRLPEEDFFDMNVVLKNSAQIKSGYWISKSAFTYSTGNRNQVYSFKPKRWCNLPVFSQETLGIDSIIRFDFYKDCFITGINEKFIIWIVSWDFGFEKYQAERIKIWNYKIANGYPGNLELLIIEIDDEATLYIYHHQLWTTYHDAYYLEGIRPHDYNFRNNWKLGSITEEMTLGY